MKYYTYRNAIKSGFAGAAAYTSQSQKAYTPRAVGGQNYTTQTQSVFTRPKKRPRNRYGGNTFAQKVRNLESAKHSTVSDLVIAQGAGGFTHNTVYTYNLTAQIDQGDGNTDREGDAIYLEALKVNGYVATTDEPTSPIQYRVMILFSGIEVNPATLGSGIGSPDIFLPQSGAIQLSSAIVNPKTCTVLDDRLFVINDYGAVVPEMSQFQYTVPLKQNYNYRGDNNAFGKMKNLYIIVIPSRLGGTTGTSPCGRVGINTDLIFKD